MPYTFQRDIAPNAGALDDGSIIGGVDRTAARRVVTSSSLASAIYAIRKDAVSGLNFTFIDLSTPAGDDTTADFEPFGTAAQMSNGDEFYFAADSIWSDAYFKIATAGAYTGSVEWRYSSNGLNADKVLTVSDDSNGFRNTGIKRVSWTPPSDLAEWSPVPDGITKRRWIVAKLVSPSAIAVAPVLDRLWVRLATASYAGQTVYNGDFATAPAAQPSLFPIIGDAIYIASDGPMLGYDIAMFLKRDDTATRVFEYLSTDGTWKSVTGLSDPSNDWKNGPAALTTANNVYNVRWTAPSDHVSTSLTLGSITDTGYWFRLRTTAVTTYGNVASPAARIRLRQFGNANTSGVRVPVASLLRSITIEEPLSIVGVGAIVLSLVNLTTGAASAIAVPDSAVWPINVDFDDLAMAAGDAFGLFYTSGTRSFSGAQVIVQ